MRSEPNREIPPLASSEDASLAEYSRLVFRLARQFYLHGGDEDDLYQEGMIGLLKAVRAYDPGKNDSFEAFATLCIRRQLYDAVRRSARLSQREEEALSKLGFIMQEAPDPETQCLANETEKEIQAALNGLLSAFEASVLSPYLAGCTVREIAGTLGCTEKSVGNAIQRIRRKLAQYLSQGDSR